MRFDLRKWTSFAGGIVESTGSGGAKKVGDQIDVKKKSKASEIHEFTCHCFGPNRPRTSSVEEDLQYNAL